VKLTTHLHVVPTLIMHGAIPSLPQYAFMAWCLVKHRDNFTLPFTVSMPLLVDSVIRSNSLVAALCLPCLILLIVNH